MVGRTCNAAWLMWQRNCVAGELVATREGRLWRRGRISCGGWVWVGGALDCFALLAVTGGLLVVVVVAAGVIAGAGCGGALGHCTVRVRGRSGAKWMKFFGSVLESYVLCRIRSNALFGAHRWTTRFSVTGCLAWTR